MKHLSVVEKNAKVVRYGRLISHHDHVAGPVFAGVAVQHAEALAVIDLAVEVHPSVPPLVRTGVIAQLDVEVVGVEVTDQLIAMVLRPAELSA